ncbi:CHASE2 domain-containing protein [Sessilibacter sp. MAH2]
MRFKPSNILLERLLFAGAMSFFAIVISIWRWGYSVDQAIYDALITTFPVQPDPELLIVAIDERSLLELGRWPWPRRAHAQLVDRLHEAGAKAIAFDVVFPESDQFDVGGDAAFAESIKRMGKVALSVHMEQTYLGGQVLEILPTPELASATEYLGHVHVEYDVDGVCRAVFLKEGLGQAYWPHLMQVLLNMVEESDGGSLPGLTGGSGSSSSFIIERDFYNLIPLSGPPPAIETVSFTDVIQGRVPARNLKDKIIIVGATARGLGDIVATSYGTMDGVEFNANVFNSLRSRTTITPVSAGIHWFLSGLSVFLLIVLAAKSTPRQYLILTVFYVVGFLGVICTAIFTVRIWFAPLSVIIPLLLFYPLWSWRRLEQAIGFLRRELIRVQTEKTPIHKTQRPLTQRLQFVASIVGIQQWHIESPESDFSTTTNGEDIAGDDTYDGDRHVKPIIVSEGNTFHKVRVSWQEPSTLERHKAALWRSAIDHNSNFLASKSPKPAELVTATISSLREATHQSEVNRLFTNRCLDLLQDAIVVANIYGDLIFQNHLASSLFSNIVGESSTILDLLKPLKIDQPWLELIRKSVLNGEVISVEASFVDTEREFFCQLSAMSWQSDQIDTLLFTFTDITAIKENEKARNEALHFLSHDLRSPVVSILALIQQYRNSLGSQNPSGVKSVDSLLDDIQAYAEKNLAFAESFLQLARAEISSDANFNLCDLHAVIDNATLMIRHFAQSKQIKISVERTMDDLWVWGDGELLERLLINLLSNAIKYSPENSNVVLRVSIARDQVFVKVIDEGIGIKQDELENVFKKFRRASNTNTVIGAGLGLHFVDIVAKKHGGHVSVTSEINRGSTFTVALPLYQDELE